MKEVAARQGLFATKALFVLEKHEEAIPILDKSIAALKVSETPENAIELKGYKAEAFIRSGNIDEGVRLGLTTFNEYDSDLNALKLKDSIDYNRWVSWRAGCILKITDSLLETNAFTSLSRDQQALIIENLKTVYKDGTANSVQFFEIRTKQLKDTWQKLLSKNITIDNIELDD
jgi:hypothetical protein